MKYKSFVFPRLSLLTASVLGLLMSCGGESTPESDGDGGQGGESATQANGGSGGVANMPSGGAAGAVNTGGAGNTGGDKAAVVDAQAPDAKPMDAGVPPSKALFAENFEAHTVGQAPADGWHADRSNGDVVVDDSKAFAGKHALKVTTSAGGPRTAYISRSGPPIFGLPNNLMWGRMMIWIDKVPQGGVHSNMVEVDGKLPDGSNAIYRVGGWAGAVTGQYMPNDCYWGADKKLPEKRWACVEWQFDGSPAGNGTRDEMRMWVDGENYVEVVHMGQGCAHGPSIAWKAPKFASIRLGWTHYQEATPVTMWIDELVIDDKRIGCPRLP